MAKILAIMASAEIAWNTDTILNSVLKKLPKNSYEKIILKEVDIEYYSHKYRYSKLEEVQFLGLIEKIKSAEILLIATPTYNFWVPAKLKNLIDRIWFISLNYKKVNKFWQPEWILGKKTYFLVTWWASNLTQKFLFMLYPIFWLRFIFAYYWAKNIWKIYIWWLSYTNHIKNIKNQNISIK